MGRLLDLVNPNLFSLTTLVQEVVNGLNSLAIEYGSNHPRQSLGYLAPVESILKTKLDRICSPVLICGQLGVLTKLNHDVILNGLYMFPFSFSFVTLNFPSSS